MKLDVGCARNKKEGYVGIDISKDSDADIIADAGNMPVKIDSVDEIRTKDFVEHFMPDEALVIFREFHRVLKNSGKYFAITDRGKSLEDLFRKDKTHKHRYEENELRRLCEQAGFEVQRCSARPLLRFWVRWNKIVLRARCRKE